MNNFSKKLLCLAILGFSATTYAAPPSGGAGNGTQAYQYNNPNYVNSGVVSQPTTGNGNLFSGKYNPTDPNYEFNPGGNNPNLNGWGAPGQGNGSMGPGNGRGPGRGAGQGCPNHHSPIYRNCDSTIDDRDKDRTVTGYVYQNIPVINTGWISRVGGDPNYAADTDGGEANLGGAHFHDMSGEGEDLTAARESAPAFRLLVGVIGGGVNIAQANASK